MRRASLRSVSASRPLKRAAHATSLGRPSDFAAQVGGEALEADAVAREEVRVVPAFLEQGVRKTEHDGDVGVRSGREPLRVEEVRHVVAQGTHVDEGDPRLARLAHVAALGVAGDAAVVDLAVLERHPSEADHELGVLDDRGPARVLALEPGEGAHDVRHDVLRRGEAVGVDGAGEATDQVQQAVQVALGVVELSGAAPAVGAGKDGSVAVGAAHALDFGGDEAFGFIPRHRNEGLRPAPFRRRARPMVEPGTAHRRFHDAQRRVHALGEGVPYRGRIFVALHRKQLAHPPVLHPDPIGAVVVRGAGHRLEFSHRGRISLIGSCARSWHSVGTFARGERRASEPLHATARLTSRFSWIPAHQGSDECEGSALLRRNDRSGVLHACRRCRAYSPSFPQVEREST